MPLDPDAAWLALRTRDARFDGRLFVGVTSTGVYCRPVCRVRTPRRENCRFFPTAAQAEAQAFRPCLKCRPEIAPGLSFADSSRSLADDAARRLAHAVQTGEALPLPALAARLGVTDRHLRRIFQAAHSVSPRDYVATQRLLRAKRLLTETALPVGQVALASGYDSVRRFNAAFVQRYRLQPGALRRAGRAADDDAGDATTLRLAWRPPYDAPAVLGFYARRQVAGLEQVDGDTLRRTLVLPHRDGMVAGWLACRLRPEANEVRVSVSPTLAPVLGAVLQRVRQALDLDADPASIDPVLQTLPVPAPPGTRLPAGWGGWEVAVRVILGQQITVKAARTLVQRLVDQFGTPLDTPFPALTRTFPTAAALAAADPADLGRLGIVRQRVGALQALARAMVDGHIALHPAAPLEPTLDALRALPGVGEWTTQVIAMRALAWPDAWPATDIGLLNALATPDGRATPAQATARAEAWRPWRAYAVMRLWQHVETAPK